MKKIKQSKLNLFYKATKIKEFDKYPLNPSQWPEDWRRIYTKLYPRLDKVQLSKKVKMISQSLSSVLLERKSRRDFNSTGKVTKKILSSILFHSAGIVPNKDSTWDNTRRFYPSAGARYPLELYLITNKVFGLKPGLYHYSVSDHSLDILWLNNKLTTNLANISGQKWVRKANILFIITGVIERTRTKYKDRGGRYIFIEAGHLAQNIYLVATAIGLKTCAIGGFIDDKINTILDLDEEVERALYIIAVGF